jgi:hypothetical protein
MLFVYIVIGLALIFYTRFFIIRSLASQSALTGTFYAAIKAVYFIPLFLQGTLLLWFSVLNFKAITQGFFLLFKYWRLPDKDEPDYNFLYLVSYLCIASLFLGFHFMLGRASLNKKNDPLNLFWKTGYMFTSYFLLKVAYLNLGLFHPLDSLMNEIYFYNHAYVIVTGAMFYLLTLLLYFFYKPVNNYFRYLQVGVLASAVYIFACLLLAVLLFLFYLLIKFIV